LGSEIGKRTPPYAMFGGVKISEADIERVNGLWEKDIK